MSNGSMHVDCDGLVRSVDRSGLVLLRFGGIDDIGVVVGCSGSLGWMMEMW